MTATRKVTSDPFKLAADNLIEYVGDGDLEAGGFFIDLSNWEFGYADAVRISNLADATGADGLILVEHVSIIIDDPSDKEFQDVCRWAGLDPNALDLSEKSGRLAYAEAAASCGRSDPADDSHIFDRFAASYVVAVDDTGDFDSLDRDSWDGWKPALFIRADDLGGWLQRAYLNSLA